VLGVLVAVFAVHATWDTTKRGGIEKEALGIWLKDPHAYQAKPGHIADVTEALAYIPSGVEVRATNDLLIQLAARVTATLVGSHQDKGSCAAIDTANPGCPVNAAFIPGYVQSLEAQGFRVVDQSGSIVILHQVG